MVIADISAKLRHTRAAQERIAADPYARPGPARVIDPRHLLLLLKDSTPSRFHEILALAANPLNHRIHQLDGRSGNRGVIDSVQTVRKLEQPICPKLSLRLGQSTTTRQCSIRAPGGLGGTPGCGWPWICACRPYGDRSFATSYSNMCARD